MSLLDSLRSKLGPDYDGAVEYRCPSCARSFAFSEKISDPTCPYCDTTEVVEQR